MAVRQFIGRLKGLLDIANGRSGGNLIEITGNYLVRHGAARSEPAGQPHRLLQPGLRFIGQVVEVSSYKIGHLARG
jgi:hypothetical protein